MYDTGLRTFEMPLIKYKCGHTTIQRSNIATKNKHYMLRTVAPLISRIDITYHQSWQFGDIKTREDVLLGNHNRPDYEQCSHLSHDHA